MKIDLILLFYEHDYNDGDNDKDDGYGDFVVDDATDHNDDEGM